MFFSNIEFVPNSTVLAIAGQDNTYGDGTILLWDFASGDITSTLPVDDFGDYPPGIIIAGDLNISLDGGMMVATVNDLLHLWDISAQTDVILQEVPIDYSRIRQVLFSSDGKLAIRAKDGDNSIVVWSNTGELLSNIKSKIDGIWFTPDGLYLVLFLPNDPPQVWEINGLP